MPGKPTLSIVAKAAGVSVPTVSQVMRRTGRISGKTRGKMLEAVGKLRYVPDSRAASMRSGENREIGFLINQFANPYNAEAMSVAVDLLQAHVIPTVTFLRPASDCFDHVGIRNAVVTDIATNHLALIRH